MSPLDDMALGKLLALVEQLDEAVNDPDAERGLRAWAHKTRNQVMPVVLAAAARLERMDGRLTDIERAMQISRGARSVVVVIAERVWPILPALLVWWLTKR